MSSTYAALLRAVNVGGRGMVAMSALRDMIESLGYVDCRTLLQSGNLVFRATDSPLPGIAIERVLEAATSKRLGVTIDYMVRSPYDWQALVNANPFPAQARRDPARLLVMFLKVQPAVADVKQLEAAIVGPETIRAVGAQLYVVYPDGVGRSKLTHALIERKLGVRATGRNWNTVLKIAALL